MLILNQFLLLEEALNIELLNFEYINDRLCRELQPQFKHDLKCKEQRLDLNKLFHLVHVFDEHLQIQKGLAVALRLIAHGSDIVYQNAVHVHQARLLAHLTAFVELRILMSYKIVEQCASDIYVWPLLQ